MGGQCGVPQFDSSSPNFMPVGEIPVNPSVSLSTRYNTDTVATADWQYTSFVPAAKTLFEQYSDNTFDRFYGNYR